MLWEVRECETLEVSRKRSRNNRFPALWTYLASKQGPEQQRGGRGGVVIHAQSGSIQGNTNCKTRPYCSCYSILQKK